MSRIRIVSGDITKMKVDAIVNAANSSLTGGGGVDGAIHKAGGPKILEECIAIVEKQGRCPAGKAVITGAGNLPSRYVIHAVGPVWMGGTAHEHDLLYECYRNSLALAEQYGCTSVAFPNISTGVYGYPKDLAARISVKAVTDYLKVSKTIRSVTFVCFDEENLGFVRDELNNAEAPEIQD